MTYKLFYLPTPA